MLGQKYRCPDFLTKSEFERKLKLLAAEDKARSKMKDLALFANAGSNGNRNSGSGSFGNKSGSFKKPFYKKGSGGKPKLSPEELAAKKAKSQCFKCGGTGHFARDCRSGKGQPKK